MRKWAPKRTGYASLQSRYDVTMTSESRRVLLSVVVFVAPDCHWSMTADRTDMQGSYSSTNGAFGVHFEVQKLSLPPVTDCVQQQSPFPMWTHVFWWEHCQCCILSRTACFLTYNDAGGIMPLHSLRCVVVSQSANESAVNRMVVYRGSQNFVHLHTAGNVCVLFSSLSQAVCQWAVSQCHCCCWNARATNIHAQAHVLSAQ